MSWIVTIVTGHHKYQFEVSSEDKAMGMAQAIMSSGVYRHIEGDKTIFHKAYSVTVQESS